MMPREPLNIKNVRHDKDERESNHCKSCWVALRGSPASMRFLQHWSTEALDGSPAPPMFLGRGTEEPSRSRRRSLWPNGSPMDRVDRQCKQTREVSSERKKEARKFFSSRPGARKASGAAQRRSKESFGTVKGSWLAQGKSSSAAACIMGWVRNVYGEKSSAKIAETFCSMLFFLLPWNFLPLWYCQVGLLWGVHGCF